jgi:hypothetical protein
MLVFPSWGALQACVEKEQPAGGAALHWLTMLLAQEIHLHTDRWSDTSRAQNLAELLQWSEAFLGNVEPDNAFVRQTAWFATRIRSYQNDRTPAQNHRPVFVGGPGERIMLIIMWSADALAQDETRTRRNVAPRRRYGMELRENQGDVAQPPFGLYDALVGTTSMLASLVIFFQ